MEVQIAADGIILMRRVHRRHTLTRLHILGTLGPVATLHPDHHSQYTLGLGREEGIECSYMLSLMRFMEHNSQGETLLRVMLS